MLKRVSFLGDLLHSDADGGGIHNESGVFGRVLGGGFFSGFVSRSFCLVGLREFVGGFLHLGLLGCLSRLVFGLDGFSNTVMKRSQ